MQTVVVERPEARLRFGDEETPAPRGVLRDGSKIELVVAVLPARDVEIMAVALVFSVDGGERRTQFRRHTGALTSSKEQFFLAQFPKLRPGAEVTYEVVVLFSFGGETETLASTHGGRARLRFSIADEVPMEPPSATAPKIASVAPPAPAAPVVAARPRERSLSGLVISDRAEAAPGVKLRLYAASFGGGRAALGEITSDASGAYRFDYASEEARDLVVCAVDADGVEIPLAQPRRATPEAARADLIVPERMVPTRRSEHAAIVSDLVAQLPEGARLGEAVEREDQRDVAWLARATGWDARLVALAASADRLAGETGLDAESLYGMLRAGAPDEADALARLDASVVPELLHAACRARVIGLDDAAIERAADAFGAFVRAVRLGARPRDARSTLAELLAAAGLEESARASVELAVVARGGDEGGLSWPGLSGAARQSAELADALAELTQGDATLLARLGERVRSMRDLVTLGLFAPDAWRSFLPEGEGAWRARAEDLAARVRERFPEESALERLSKTGATDPAAIRRLARIGVTPLAIDVLFGAGYRSALDVVRAGREAFVAATSSRLAPDVVETIHQRAADIVAATIAGLARAPAASDRADTIVGPRAYCLDTLAMIRASAGDAAIDRLAERRPDVVRAAQQRGPSKEVPEIELVRAVIEADLERQGGRGEVERAWFPLTLPFDAPREMLAALAAEAGGSLAELSAAFDPDLARADDRPMGPSAWACILGNLGIGPLEAPIFLASQEVVERHEELFGERSGADLEARLPTARAIAARLGRADGEELDTAAAAIEKILERRGAGRRSAAFWVRLHIAARLGDKLGWSMSDVDRALSVLAPPNAGRLSDGMPTALVHLASLVELERALGTSPEERDKLIDLFRAGPDRDGSVAFLARVLGVSVVDFEGFVAALRLDPVGPVTSEPLRRRSDDVIAARTLPFVRAVRALGEQGLSGADAARLARFEALEGARRLHLGAVEVDVIASEEAAGSWLLRLVPYLSLKRRLRASGATLSMVFRSASVVVAPTATEDAARRELLRGFSEALASLSKHRPEDVASVANALDPGFVRREGPGAFSLVATRLKDPTILLAILRALDVAAELGLRGRDLAEEPGFRADAVGAGAVGRALSLFTEARGQARGEQLAARARARVSPRLVRALRAAWARRSGVSEAAIEDRLLLSPVAADDAKTTPIEHAADALSRFAGRCLLGIEDPSGGSAGLRDRERWARARSFEAWKAAREAVLFPDALGPVEPTPAFLDLLRALDDAEGYPDEERAYVAYARACSELGRPTAPGKAYAFDRAAFEGAGGGERGAPALAFERQRSSAEPLAELPQASIDSVRAERLVSVRSSNDWLLVEGATVTYRGELVGRSGWVSRAPLRSEEDAARTAPFDRRAAAAHEVLERIAGRVFDVGPEGAFEIGAARDELDEADRYGDLAREILFHAPLAAALSASRAGRHADAQRWLDGLFRFFRGPTSADAPPKGAFARTAARSVLFAVFDNLAAWAARAREAGSPEEAARLERLANDVLDASERDARELEGTPVDEERLARGELETRFAPRVAEPEVVRDLLRDLLSGEAGAIPEDPHFTARRRAIRARGSGRP